MPHKACFHCNLLFEAAPAHMGIAVPCPNCTRTLEDYQVTEEVRLDSPIGSTTMGPQRSAKVSTTMFQLPTGSRSTRSTDPELDRPTRQRPVADVDDDELFTSANDEMEEAPTRALNTRAMRRATGQLDSEAPTRALSARAMRKATGARFDSESPTGAMDAKRLKAGASDMDDDAPTRALDAQKLRQAVQLPAVPEPVPEPGPSPAGGVRGVSGPVPKRRARPPTPAAPPEEAPPEPPRPAPRAEAPAPARGPVPARRHRPAGAPPEPAPAPPTPEEPAEAPRPARAEIPRPPARQTPAPRPMPRPAPPPAESAPDVPPYFEESRAMEVPDAMGSLIAQQRPGPAPVERATVVPRPSRPAKKRSPFLLVALVVVLGLIGGAIALVKFRNTEVSPTQVDGGEEVKGAAPASEEQSAWQDRLTQALDRAQIKPPDGRGEALEESDFVVAGPEGVATSKGPVVGLMTTPIPDGAVDRDEGGEAVRPLLTALGQAERERVLLGLDRRVDARTLARVLYSTWRAGYRHISLLTRRGQDFAGVELIPHRPGTPLPAAGGVVLRVGQLAVSAVVEGRDGRVVGERPAPLPRLADGNLDFEGLDKLLDELASQHPRVRDAVVHVNGDLGLEPLVGVLTRVRGSDKRDRFTTIALAVQ